MTLAPLKYYLEQKVVHKIIPDASKVSNRRKLQDYPAAVQEEEDVATSFDHSKWNAVLQRHVRRNVQLGGIQNVSVVDYDSLATDADFYDYIQLLAAAQPARREPGGGLVAQRTALDAPNPGEGDDP